MRPARLLKVDVSSVFSNVPRVTGGCDGCEKDAKNRSEKGGNPAHMYIHRQKIQR